MGLVSQRPEASPPTSQKKAIPPDAATEELLLGVAGMWCSSCAWLIEHVVSGLPGVVSTEVSFASDTVKVTYHPQYLPAHLITARINSLDIAPNGRQKKTKERKRSGAICWSAPAWPSFFG